MPIDFQTLGVFNRDGSTFYVASRGTGANFHTNIPNIGP
jgi:hypothetical protein